MNYGTGKPKLQLRNADGTLNEELTFPYAEVCEPEFDLDEIKFKAQDGTLSMYNRGWWPKLDLYFPALSDTEYKTLVRMMKRQFDFDVTEDATRFIRLIPRVDNAIEYYDGFITTPIKVLNQFHSITHGAKIAFEGKKRLAQNEFLVIPVTNGSLTWDGAIALGNMLLTFDAVPTDATVPITYEWRFNTVLEATHTDKGVQDTYTHNFVSGDFPAGQSNQCYIEIKAIQGNFVYTEQFNVVIGQLSL